MISVVIPAHNEERVLKRCLEALLEGAEPRELEVIVVCNGCSDGTLEVARYYSDQLQILELPHASKNDALNLGDQAASSFPRFFLDADVVCSIQTLRCLASALESPQILAVAPLYTVSQENCSWSVKAYYTVNNLLPLYRAGFGGAGIYGLSELGRHRFKKFHEIYADDTFIRLMFADSEWRTVRCYTEIFAPKNLIDLIRIKTRSHFGGRELREKFPNLRPYWRKNWLTLMYLALNPLLLPKVFMYVFIRLSTRIRCYFIYSKTQKKWERDESAR